MAPAMGMNVIYHQAVGEREFNHHPNHAAVITEVHSDGLVNLKVFFDCGPVEDRTSVHLLGSGPTDNPHGPPGAYWTHVPKE